MATRVKVHFTHPDKVLACLRRDYPCAVQQVDVPQSKDCPGAHDAAADIVRELYPGCAVLETVVLDD